MDFSDIEETEYSFYSFFIYNDLRDFLPEAE